MLKRIYIILLCLLAVILVAIGAAEVISKPSFHVSPRAGFEPLTIKARMSVPYHVDNVALCYGWKLLDDEPEDFQPYGRSCMELKKKEATTYWTEWRLPYGDYIMFMEIRSVKTIRFQATAPVKILESLPH